MTAETSLTLRGSGFGVLLGELRRRGFMPADSGDRFDFPVRDGVVCVPRGLVRVALDDNVTVVYAMTGGGVLLWDARLSDGVPMGVVASVIDQAIAHVVTVGADVDAIGRAWG
jgi:hypothetical protein